jgi:hypothetical protein
MLRHCEYCMHKEHRYYKNDEERRDGRSCRGGRFKCEQGGRAQ